MAVAVVGFRLPAFGFWLVGCGWVRNFHNCRVSGLTAQLIKNAALAAGFDAAGIARVGDTTPDADKLLAWLAAGRQGTMNYLLETAERRADIRRWAPFANSVLMVAQNYSPEAPGTADAHAGAGLVARYARGADYHNLMVKKLRRLGRALQRDQGYAFGPWRSFVDAGAILEKAWGAAAGLGWIGKNTLLMNRTQGSWFLLGGLVLSCAVEPDPPVANHCGECRACLDACPTGAFTAPWQLDARKCISYLTIELRSAIPTELRHGVGEWLFGCDICQDVCPWNHRAPLATATEFAPRSESNPYLRRRITSSGSAPLKGWPSGCLSNPQTHIHFKAIRLHKA